MVNPFKNASAPKSPAAPAGSFLPTDYIENRRTGRISLIGAGLLIVVMAGVVGAFLVTTRHRSAIREQQDQINTEYTAEAKKIEQLKQLEVQRREMMEKAEVTAALLEKVPRSMLMAELVTRMPKDVTLLDLELKGKRIDAPKPVTGKAQLGKPAAKPAAKVKSLSTLVKGGELPATDERKITPPRFEFTLTLTGVASVNNDIAEYLGQLQGCPLLGSVELQYIQQTVIDDLNMRRFQIVAQIKPNADAHDLVSLKPEPKPEAEVQAPTEESKAATADAEAAAAPAAAPDKGGK